MTCDSWLGDGAVLATASPRPCGDRQADRDGSGSRETWCTLDMATSWARHGRMATWR